MSSTSNHEDKSTKAPPSSLERYLISALLIVIGIGAMLFFVTGIVQDTGIQAAVNWVVSEESPTQPSLILVFLERFGIVLPALVLFLGMFSIIVGTRLLSGQIRNAQWAKMSFLWLTIGLIVFVLLNIYNLLRLNGDDEATITSMMLIMQIIVPIIATVISGFIWYWFERNMETHFIGEDRSSG